MDKCYWTNEISVCYQLRTIIKYYVLFMQFTDVFDSDIMKIESARIYRQQAESMTTCLIKKKCRITEEIYLVICLSNPVFKQCHKLISPPECRGSIFIVAFLSSTCSWNWQHDGNTSYCASSVGSYDDLNMQTNACTQPHSLFSEWKHHTLIQKYTEVWNERSFLYTHSYGWAFRSRKQSGSQIFQI